MTRNSSAHERAFIWPAVCLLATLNFAIAWLHHVNAGIQTQVSKQMHAKPLEFRKPELREENNIAPVSPRPPALPRSSQDSRLPHFEQLPEAASVVRSETYWAICRKYSPLIEQLDLNPEDAAALIALLEEKVRIKSPGPEESSMSAALKLHEEIKGDIKELLGESNFQLFERFSTQLPIRENLGKIATRMNARGIPLSDAQTQAILSVLGPESFAGPEQFTMLGRPFNDESLARIYSHLTKEQAAVFVDIQNDRIDEQQLRASLTRK